jgi:ABC-type multidrug transport system permease subunit
MTILRLGLYYAKNNSKILINTFKHDQFFCFYATVVIDSSLQKYLEEPFSYQTIKQDHEANMEKAVVLSEKYTELIGGRFSLVKAVDEKSINDIKFVVELSLYHS